MQPTVSKTPISGWLSGHSVRKESYQKPHNSYVLTIRLKKKKKREQEIRIENQLCEVGLDRFLKITLIKNQ